MAPGVPLLLVLGGDPFLGLALLFQAVEEVDLDLSEREGCAYICVVFCLVLSCLSVCLCLKV